MKYFVILIASILLYFFVLHEYLNNIIINIFSGRIYERGANSKNSEGWMILFIFALFFWVLFQYFIYKSPKPKKPLQDPASEPTRPDTASAQGEARTDINITAPSLQGAKDSIDNIGTKK